MRPHPARVPAPRSSLAGFRFPLRVIMDCGSHTDTVACEQSMRGRFTADQLQTMIDLYKSGATAEQLAQTSGFSQRSVKRLLQQHGIRREHQSRS
jgi:hypothetical protein